MLSTKVVIELLRRANRGIRVTEDAVRSAIRRGKVEAPSTFAGRLVWSARDVAALATALGLRVPDIAMEPS